MTAWNHPEPQTVRPRHRVVEALEDPNPVRAFLHLVRESLGPGQWEYETEGGFEWIPYRLAHSVEGVETFGGFACRSKFGLVEAVTDEQAALEWMTRLNQRGLGGAAFYDPEDQSIWVGAVARLDPSQWWNAFLFLESVTRQVGICERLAPRLAEWVGGQVRARSHPTLGTRSSPDQFYLEHAVETYQPEATTGLWWSPAEIRRAQFLFDHMARQNGGSVASPSIGGGERETATMAVNVVLPLGEGQVLIESSEIDHPEFGFGPRIAVSSTLGPLSPIKDAVSAHRWTLEHANLLNQGLYDYAVAPLTVGGWCASDDQLVYHTFLIPQVARTVQSLGAPLLGDLWTLAVFGTADNAPLVVPFEDMAWERRAPVSAKPPVNPEVFSLLADPAPSAGRLEITDGILEEPIELGFDDWCLASRTLVTFGIFNPFGPSLGSIEVVEFPEVNRLWVTQRLRHPMSPSLALWAVLPTDNPAVLTKCVEQALARSSWSSFHWVAVKDSASAISDAVMRGLIEFAKARADDFGRLAEAMRSAAGDPWRFVDAESTAAPGQSSDSDIASWIGQITDPEWVNAFSAYIRSGWEGAMAFVNPTVESADQVSARLKAEVKRRSASLI